VRTFRSAVKELMKRLTFATAAAAAIAAVAAMNVGAAGLPACDPDNGGLKLPQGFCALVAADDVGAARHMLAMPNGDLYVATQGSQGHPAGVVGLRDANGDGKFEVTERFGDKSTTGIAFRNGYIYIATISSVERFKITAGELKPGPAEVVVADLPITRPHQDKGIAFDGRGGLYVSIGAPSNACQPQDRRPKVAGQDPCPLLDYSGGVWKFDENKPGQKQADGTRYATGMRQMPAIVWHDGALYAVMNNRDQLDTLWSDQFVGEDNQTRPAEPMFRIEQGANYGWPFCFFDYTQNKLLLNPEYGGDGKTVGRCAEFKLPIAAFPAHWAPVDVMFYTGTQFPVKYRGGAFIAFHGSWNRSPAVQDGYNVTFQPVANGKASGKFEIFADGFAGAQAPRTPNQATWRADGVAQAPDGTLFITESNKGRIWRVVYTGK
jgi:glucose/arabinose dehydrogenase